MKKIVLLLSALLLVMGLSSIALAAPILTAGDIAFKFSDVTYYDLPATLSAPVSDGTGGFVTQSGAPGGTGSGITIGLAAVTGIYTINTAGGGTLENPILNPVPIWTPTAGDLLVARIGGTVLTGISPGSPVSTVPDGSGGAACPGVNCNFPGMPYNSYFSAGTSIAGFTKDFGGVNGITNDGYIEIFETTGANYALDVANGPDGLPGINPVTGLYGSFGQNVATGTLWLDIAMTPGILGAYEPKAAPGNIEVTTINALATAAVTIRGTIEGGTAAPFFLTGVFPENIPTWGSLPGQNRADIAFKANLTAQFDQNPLSPNFNTWTNSAGWMFDSQDPVTGAVVPEPSTILLLGAGLLGLGFSRRKRMLK